MLHLTNYIIYAILLNALHHPNSLSPSENIHNCLPVSFHEFASDLPWSKVYLWKNTDTPNRIQLLWVRFTCTNAWRAYVIVNTCFGIFFKPAFHPINHSQVLSSAIPSIWMNAAKWNLFDGRITCIRSGVFPQSKLICIIHAYLLFPLF